MVTTSFMVMAKFKKIPRIIKEGFMDTLRVYVRAGSGGNGYPK